MSSINGASPWLEKGFATRRSVLGDAHVDRAQSNCDDFDAPFQNLIDQWTKRERSMVTIALLAALGHYDEMAMHIRATVRTGATEDDIREALLHVAIYAGVPAANHAIKIARDTLAEMKEQAGENR
jgi:4-carboxymuconolactone decarboxylase